MDNRFDWKKWLLVLAAGAIAVLSVLLVLQVRRAQAAEHTLNETTLAALADAAEEVQALALAMDKLSIASSQAQTAALLHEVVLSADRARHSLTLLPAEPQQIAPLLSFLARLSREAGSLLTQAGSGLPVTSGERSDLAASTASLTLLHAELSLARDSLLQGEPLSAAMPESALPAQVTAAELAEYRALPQEEINSGAAMQIARDFVGTNRVTGVSHAADAAGAMPVYGVTVQTRDLTLTLGVTRRGGKVLYMSPETAGFAMAQSTETCEKAASDFLAARGFVTMQPAWYQVYDGLCVMTFVHEAENALVWADRVTVQVRMDTAEVVGLEARSYWQNHTPRRIGTPLLTAEEARTGLAPGVTEQSVRLALLPVGTQERLCWQFAIARDGESYISFIDATTGREVLLEKVMQLEYGAIPA